MSPARSKRTPIPQRRSRADIVKAVGVAAGIVLVTALIVWLMRPGSPGTLGTGGYINRQPRASWLVGLALGVGAAATWWILRVSRKARERVNVVLPITLGVVLVLTVIGGVAWPGGLLRHDHAPPKVVAPPTTLSTTPPTSATTAPKTATTTTAPTPTSNAGGTSPNTSPITTTSTGAATTKSP